jgi:hypothetical protein
MALGTTFGQGGAMTFKMGSTQYETNIIGVREILESSGGQAFTTADGLVHRNASTATVVGIEITLPQDLTAAAFWRYLRETTPTTATAIITGTSSATPSVSNPKWTYSVTGWEQPALEFQPGSASTPTATLWVSGNPTVATA